MNRDLFNNNTGGFRPAKEVGVKAGQNFVGILRVVGSCMLC